MQSIGNDSQKVIETIEITKKDEVYLKINCEAGVAQEICDYLHLLFRAIHSCRPIE